MTVVFLTSLVLAQVGGGVLLSCTSGAMLLHASTVVVPWHTALFGMVDKSYPPLRSNRPCLVSGGGEGTGTFHFPNFLGRLDNEVLRCVCGLVI